MSEPRIIIHLIWHDCPTCGHRCFCKSKRWSECACVRRHEVDMVKSLGKLSDEEAERIVDDMEFYW